MARKLNPDSLSAHRLKRSAKPLTIRGMQAHIRLAKGGFQHRPLPDSGRFEVEDGRLSLMTTTPEGAPVSVGTFEAGEWLERWMQPDGQLEQFGHVTAGT